MGRNVFMVKRIVILIGLVAVLSWTAPNLFADHGNHGKHGKHGNKHDDDQGWERRDGYEYRVYEGDERPPGWGHGKKTGWGNCGMPPGQAKKQGCQAYVYEDRQYYYHQDDQGRIVVRRPIIEIQGSISVH
jgi:hypothetical protein